MHVYMYIYIYAMYIYIYAYIYAYIHMHTSSFLVPLGHWVTGTLYWNEAKQLSFLMIIGTISSHF